MWTLSLLSTIGVSFGPASLVYATRDQVDVYFGNGCFWERQYAYAMVEINSPSAEPGNDEFVFVPSRNYIGITAVVGYAGSTRRGADSLVCYHNQGPNPSNDYASLGYTEVTQVSLDRQLQKQQFALFVRNFLKSFQGPNGARVRPDPEDEGGQYRSCIGIPGGINNTELFTIIQAANRHYGMQLRAGNGEDADEASTVWIYDSEKLPFVRGEQYHQFHSDFHPGGDYDGWYRGCLRMAQIHAGKIEPTGCPEAWPLGTLQVPCPSDANTPGSELMSGPTIAPINSLLRPIPGVKPGSDVIEEGASMCSRSSGKGHFLPENHMRWQVRAGLRFFAFSAEEVCCNNHRFAETSGYWLQNADYAAAAQAASAQNPLVHFDSVCGVPLFVAPVGRSSEEWLAESTRHGWPSFRPAEIFAQNIVIGSDGEVQSVCGTHLGHNIPDGKGDRFCIDLVCIAGTQQPASPSWENLVPAKTTAALRKARVNADTVAGIVAGQLKTIATISSIIGLVLLLGIVYLRRRVFRRSMQAGSLEVSLAMEMEENYVDLDES